jgi:hypothetical protein
MDLVLKKSMTMTSTQFAEMTGKAKGHIHRTVRDNFDAELRESIIGSSIGSNGMISDYHLPETESIMLAAMLDKSYLRKIAEFWKNRNELLPKDLPSALRSLADREEALQIALDTKAEIGSRREATSMNTASTATKKANKLEIELDQSKTYCTMKRMEMLCHGQKFDWRLLKTTLIEMNIPALDVFDVNYGTVKAYHKDVWMEAYGLMVEI